MHILILILWNVLLIKHLLLLELLWLVLLLMDLVIVIVI